MTALARFLPIAGRLVVVLLLAALLTGAIAAAQPAAPGPAPVLGALSQLRWQHRVLLVFAGDGLADEVALLHELAAQLEERDMIWFVFQGGRVRTNYPGELAEGFGERGLRTLARGDRVLLLGKDGGVKSRTSALDPDYLFSLIDAMPMRQRELHERGGGDLP